MQYKKRRGKFYEINDSGVKRQITKDEYENASAHVPFTLPTLEKEVEDILDDEEEDYS